MRRSALGRLADEGGMSIIEAMVAAMLLMGGILGSVFVIDQSRALTTVSERTEVAVHRAQMRLELAKSVPFAALELAQAPGGATEPLDPRGWVTGTPPQLDWDQASSTNAVEPLVVKPSATANPDAIVSRVTWSDGRWTGTSDTFVSLVNADLKRITVAVRVAGAQAPRRAIVASTLVSRQAGLAP